MTDQDRVPGEKCGWGRQGSSCVPLKNCFGLHQKHLYFSFLAKDHRDWVVFHDLPL